jgi:dolichyl-phosphate-mannose-protein mannosyltransferase
VTASAAGAGLPARPLAARGAAIALAAVVLAALALRAAGLSGQPLVPDDGAVGQTAVNFVEQGWPEPTMWNHPRLRDLLVYASIQALGPGPWGLKLWSVLLGALSVPALAALVLLLTGSAGAAALAAGLLAIDPLHVDFSRQAINDVYLSAFPVAAIAALLRYRETRAPAWVAAAGVALGLGLASKWSAPFPVGVAAVLVLVPALREAEGWRARTAELALFAGCLVALPAAIYLLTFAPWFSRGHGLVEWLRLQGAMARETATHVGYAGTKLPGYPGEIVSALRWFVSPTWYVDYIPPPPPTPPTEGIFVVALGNPLSWLATLPAAAWAGWRAWRERDAAAGWLLALFLAAYLPFVLVPRPVWPNSALAVLPFQAALVGWAAWRLHRRLALPVRIWAAAALGLAALLWLPAMGLRSPVPDRLVKALVAPETLDPRSHPLP